MSHLPGVGTPLDVAAPHGGDGITTVTPGSSFRIQTSDNERAVPVETQSTGELRDLVGMRRDLTLTRRFAELWRDFELQLFAESRPDESAFWIAALTLYGRAFGKGARRARVDVSALSSAQADMHRYLLSVRDKYVAHSVNDYEQAHPYAIIRDFPDGSGAVTGFSVLLHDAAGISQEQADELVALCDLHLAQLEARIAHLFEMVRQEFLDLGGNHISRLPEFVVENLGNMERVTKPRKR